MNETERVQKQTRNEWLNDYFGNEKETEMSLTVSDKGGDFTQVPQGTHMAISNMVVDLGLQETPFGNKQQIYIRWELPEERIAYEKDGVSHEGPLSIGAFFTASLNEKSNLRKVLEGWRGRAFTEQELKGFDVFNVLGVPCQVTVTHNEKGKARVSGVSGWPKGLEKPKGTENKLVKYSSDDPEQYEELPDWLKEIIGKQLTRADNNSAENISSNSDDIPF